MIQRTGSVLVRVLTCHLSVPSHYLKQFWHIVNWALQTSVKTVFHQTLDPSLKTMDYHIFQAKASDWITQRTFITNRIPRNNHHENLFTSPDLDELIHSVRVTHIYVSKLEHNWLWLWLVSGKILTDCHLDIWKHTSKQFYLKFKSFHSQKCISKCLLKNGGHLSRPQYVDIIMYFKMSLKMPSAENIRMCQTQMFAKTYLWPFKFPSKQIVKLLIVRLIVCFQCFIKFLADHCMFPAFVRSQTFHFIILCSSTVIPPTVFHKSGFIWNRWDSQKSFQWHHFHPRSCFEFLAIHKMDLTQWKILQILNDVVEINRDANFNFFLPVLAQVRLDSNFSGGIWIVRICQHVCDGRYNSANGISQGDDEFQIWVHLPDSFRSLWTTDILRASFKSNLKYKSNHF